MRYETLNIAGSAIHTSETQNSVITETETLAASTVDDLGAVFPAQDSVVIAER